MWRPDPLTPLPNLKKDLVEQMNKVPQGRWKFRNSFCVKTWSYKDDRVTLFSLNIKRGSGHGLWPGRFMSNTRKNFFTKRSSAALKQVSLVCKDGNSTDLIRRCYGSLRLLLMTVFWVGSGTRWPSELPSARFFSLEKRNMGCDRCLKSATHGMSGLSVVHI